MRHDRYDLSLPETCQRLHQHCIGSGDPIPEPELDALLRWLEWRLLTWETRGPTGRWAAYDNAMKALAQATLAECRERPGALAAPTKARDGGER
jgi:hypothetical protein